MIGLKDSRQFFSQWDAKPKPIAPCTRDFSCALSESQIIARNCDWFIALPGCDWSEKLIWFWFFDSHLKTALPSTLHSVGSENKDILFKYQSVRKLRKDSRLTNGAWDLSSLTNRVQVRTVTYETTFSRAAHTSKGKTGISEMYILSVVSAAIEPPSASIKLSSTSSSFSHHVFPSSQN